jgi:ADP-ribose pyrophosphatase YjhB (NUDIX family)
MRALAFVFNHFPVRWQRRFLDASHDRFLVGVVGLGIDGEGHILLARHRFGSPQWRFLGGVLKRSEGVEDALAREIREETSLDIEIGPILEVVTGHRWQHVDILMAYRVVGGEPALSAEVAALQGFAATELPAMRADQRGMVERHGAHAAVWARERGGAVTPEADPRRARP